MLNDEEIDYEYLSKISFELALLVANIKEIYPNRLIADANIIEDSGALSWALIDHSITHRENMRIVAAALMCILIKLEKEG